MGLFTELPDVYRNMEYVPELTAYWDAQTDKASAAADSLSTFVNPATAPASWLDFLATLYGLQNLYWNKVWPEETKRAMLNWDWIERRGNGDVLSQVLAAAGYPNEVKTNGDFIVGVGLVGDLIGTQPWTYTLTLPTRFQLQMYEIDRICYYWQPCWLQRVVVYTDEPFIIDVLYSTGDGTVLSPDGTEAYTLGEEIE